MNLSERSPRAIRHSKHPPLNRCARLRASCASRPVCERARCEHVCAIESIARDDQGNVVTDSFGVPRPRLDFVLDDYTLKGAAAFQAVSDEIIKRMSGGRQSKAQAVDGFFGAGHVMGTMRMGNTPSSSVTNSYGRSWDHPNLWLTGSGLFPTVCTANPTLTIVAVTLRQADALIDELRHRDTSNGVFVYECMSYMGLSAHSRGPRCTGTGRRSDPRGNGKYAV